MLISIKSRELDTVGFMTRDAHVATSVIEVLTTGSRDMTTNHCSSQLQLLYPVDIFRASCEYADFVETVVQKLETFLGVKRTNIDIRAQFIEDGVSAGQGSMEEFLKNVGAHPLSSPPS